MMKKYTLNWVFHTAKNFLGCGATHTFKFDQTCGKKEYIKSDILEVEFELLQMFYCQLPCDLEDSGAL